MKRFTFLSALFSLPLLGSSPKGRSGPCGPSSGGVQTPAWRCGDGTPFNNQCPTCGTMAEAILGNDRHVVFNGDRPGTLLASDMQMHRCLRCNAAFWQRAE